MKIYLILLAISFVGYLVTHGTMVEHLRKYHHKDTNFFSSYLHGSFLANVKVFILILMILPYTVTLFEILFAYDKFAKQIDDMINTY